MRMIEQKIGDNAKLTGFIHEVHDELPNIDKFPAIVVLPGGGFRFCSFREGEPVAAAYYAQGFQAFVLEYTVVSKKEDATIDDPIKDVTEAFNYLKAHGEEFFLATDKIALLGFSGGGHLAAAVSVKGRVRPNALILGYPGIIHNDLRALDCPDICESVNENTPECFMFGMTNDSVTPPDHMLAFANALSQNNIPFEMHMFRGFGHGLSLGNSFVSSGFAENVRQRYAGWFTMSLDWLKEVFGDFKLYGVNDNRNTPYNIDKTVDILFSNDRAKEICIKKMPVLAKVAESDARYELTPRKINSFMSALSKQELADLDDMLSSL